MERKILNTVRGFNAVDGAGVKLVRVLGNQTTDAYDPILMLDSFDSENPDDYTAGFPMHPHRGIETISWIVLGNMVHKDSIGNEDGISDGEVQWMSAGSGIMHEELLPASKRMLGVQLWLNLPKKYKMVKPEYKAIKKDEIQVIEIPNGELRLLSGQYKEYIGYQSKYLPLDYYDIRLKPNSKFKIETHINKSIMLFMLLGDAKIQNEIIKEKTAVKLTQGEYIEIESLDEDLEVLFISSDRLDEPIAWGGPIVMNTQEELQEAFRELRSGTFLKENKIEGF
ncbi:MAG: pirin family protein [Erysipelotrichaceae bacterium]|nr:pirin family protein [Erysipelotrichaceae bacterium]